MQSFTFPAYTYQNYQPPAPFQNQYAAISPTPQASLQMSYAQKPEINHFLEVLDSLKSTDTQLRALTVDKLMDIAIPVDAAKQTIDFWLAGLKQSKHDSSALAKIEFALRHAFAKRLRLIADSVSSQTSTSAGPVLTQPLISQLMSPSASTDSMHYPIHESSSHSHQSPISSHRPRSAAIPIVRPPAMTSKVAALDGHNSTKDSVIAPMNTNNSTNPPSLSLQQPSHAIEIHKPPEVESGHISVTPAVSGNNVTTSSSISELQSEKVNAVPGEWPTSSPAPVPHLATPTAEVPGKTSIGATLNSSLPSPAASQQSRLSEQERVQSLNTNAARFLQAIKRASVSEIVNDRYRRPSSSAVHALSPHSGRQSSIEETDEGRVWASPSVDAKDTLSESVINTEDINISPSEKKPPSKGQHHPLDTAKASDSVSGWQTKPPASVDSAVASAWDTPADAFGDAETAPETPAPQPVPKTQSSWWDSSPQNFTSHPVLKPSEATKVVDPVEPVSATATITPIAAESQRDDRAVIAKPSSAAEESSKLFKEMQERMEEVRGRIQAESGFMTREQHFSPAASAPENTAAKQDVDNFDLKTTTSTSSAPLIIYALTETLPWPPRHVHAALRHRYGSTGYQLYKPSSFNPDRPVSNVDIYHVVIDPNYKSRNIIGPRHGTSLANPDSFRLQLVGDRAGPGGRGFYGDMVRIDLSKRCTLCKAVHPHNICRALVPVPDDGDESEQENRDIDNIMYEVRSCPFADPGWWRNNPATSVDASTAAIPQGAQPSSGTAAVPERVDTPHAANDDWAKELYEPVTPGATWSPTGNGEAASSTRSLPLMSSGMFSGMKEYENSYGATQSMEEAWAAGSPQRSQKPQRGSQNVSNEKTASAIDARTASGGWQDHGVEASKATAVEGLRQDQAPWAAYGGSGGGGGAPSPWDVPEDATVSAWNYRDSSLLD